MQRKEELACVVKLYETKEIEIHVMTIAVKQIVSKGINKREVLVRVLATEQSYAHVIRRTALLVAE